MTTLSIRELRHSYGATPALGGVDLDVAPGEIVALLGRSGCGKTTLLRAVAGLVTPTGGSVALAGQLVVDGGRERVPTERRGVGLVFQEYALFPSMSVAVNVGFGLRGRDPARVAALLDRLELSDLADRRPAALSGGQQQRVALARALAPRPSILLLDEPFANLDGALRVELGALLREAVRAEGAAALLVSHDRADALALADRVALLAPGPQGGVVIRDAPPVEAYGDPRSVEAALLTGDAWLLAGEPDGSGARTALGAVAEAGGEPTGWLAVRPEGAAFTPGDGVARVRHAAFQGPTTLLLVDDPRLPHPALVAHAGPVPAGAAGDLRIDRAAWVAPGGHNARR
jgi:iron(III) transport system ATP-binding protein